MKIPLGTKSLPGLMTELKADALDHLLACASMRVAQGIRIGREK